MESEVIKTISTQGAWALLAFGLVFYTLKAQEKRDEVQEKREQKYQEIITKMTDKLELLAQLSEDIKEIKNKIK